MSRAPQPAASAREVRPFRGTPAEWDAFVRATDGATACHLSGWDAPLGVLGHAVERLVAIDAEGRIAAVLPLVLVCSRIFGRYLVSMPFLNDGGPIGDPDGRRRLAEAARDRAREAGVDLLELRGRTPVEADGLTTTDRKITVMLDLPTAAEDLWENGFRAKLRSQIRRPMKEGMEVRFGPAEVEPFYTVFARNMRDLGTPVLPQGFFRALADAMPDVVHVGVVYHEGRAVAGGVGLALAGELEMTWASSLREVDRLAPNMLLYWAFMERAIECGNGRFNFGRCTPGSGTHRFKRQWGGTDVPLPWAQWSASGVAATPTPDRGVMPLAVKVWRRLPVALTNRVGPLIARRIP